MLPLDLGINFVYSGDTEQRAASGACRKSGMTAAHWLSRNLQESFAIVGHPHDWLMSLWNAIQVFDDMADGDHPDRVDLFAAIADTLCNMPANPFFREHAETLIPLLGVAILKWKAADDAEIERRANEISYVWRAGYYDIVLAVLQLVHGEQVAMDVAHHVMRLYGETYAAYQEEFS